MRHWGGWLLLVATAGACRYDETAVPPGREEIVVHAVLDPGRLRHFVLLERVLTGRTPVTTQAPFDSLDPISSRGGAPVSSALVVVYGPSGDSAVATERRAPSDGRGTGLYEFLNRADARTDPAISPSVPIVPGGTYRLKVITEDGHAIKAATAIPEAPSASRSASLQAFNRDTENLFLFWRPVPGAARYAIVASSPRGAYSTFVDSLEFAVAGSLQNATIAPGGDVFVPGFVQEVVALAVDENYFNYFRSGNDGVTGRGLLNDIEGGIGVFGSVVMLRMFRLNVTADIDHPLEGQYIRASGSGPPALQLFVTRASTSESTLSGSYSSPGQVGPGLLGTMRGDSISLALLRGQSARDTALVIDGVLDAVSLRGRIRAGGGDVVYQMYNP